MSKEIYIELDETEKNVLSKMIDDYKGLFELAKRIREKNDTDIAIMNYIQYIIGTFSKLVKTNTINLEDSKKLEEYYIANTKEIETGRHASAYDVHENNILKGIIDKIHKEIESV